MRWMWVLWLGSVAWAQDVDSETGRPIRYQERTELIFGDGVRVDARIVAPEVVVATELKRPAFNPLIRLRTEFGGELTASLDEVK